MKNRAEKKNIKLFLLPFAGGSVYAYNSFKEFLPPNIDFVPLELPGRGMRLSDKVITNIHLAADDIYDKIMSQLNSPYCIYGHSMGSLLGYLVVKKIIAAGRQLPEHLFASGRGGPSVKINKKNRHLMTDTELIGDLKNLDGSSDEVLNDPDIINFFLPIIRADFQATEAYEYQKTKPFPIPITVMTGEDEEISQEDIIAWKKETSGIFSFYKFSGNHFFIYKHQKEIIKIITHML